MRNLKRALSLTLASVMLLGMMVVGSSAAKGYDDVKETDNVEAIEVLQAIGVMVGDERGFGPDRPVNRAEMAVVMSLLLNLDYNYYATSCPFGDVYDWARGPVGACYANKIVSGRGEGVYDPGSTVTAVEAASMLMRALGYFQYSNDYDGGFELATVRQGTKIGIFDGVGSSATTPMTRNQVAQMVLNALQSDVVEPDGNTINLTTPDGSVLTGKVNYVSVTRDEAYAHAISWTQATSVGSTNDGWIVELGERLYNGKLQLTEDIDVFGRPSRKWEYDGKGIGTYAKKELLDKEYVGEVTGKDLFDLLGSTTLKDYTTYCYIDGVYTDGTGAKAALDNNAADANRAKYYFNAADMNKNNKAKIGGTGTGSVTQVYVDHDDDQVYVVVINTYLAIADKDYDAKKEEASITAYSIRLDTGINEYIKVTQPTAASRNFKLAVEDFPDATEIKKDEALLITVADGEVQTFKPAEVLSAVTISAFKPDSKVVVDGTTYNYTTTAAYKNSDLAVWTDLNTTNLKDRTYNVYLDAYGNLIGVEEVEAKKNYVFITGIDLNGSNRVNQTADASAIFIDGTMDSIKVNMTRSEWQNEPTGDGESLLNTWCTYTKNGDVYTVKEVSPVAANGNGRPGYPLTFDTAKRNDTKLAQYQQTGNSDFKIDAKNYRLRGAGTLGAGADFYSVYGDSDTVYLTAKLGELRIGGGGDGTNDGIIKDVTSVTTGIENANLTVWAHGTAVTKANDSKVVGTVNNARASSGVYTLYNNDGIIIAAVVVGEDAGTAKDLVYVTSSSMELEADNGDSATKAAGDGLWTWSRVVVRDGEEVTLYEVGDNSKEDNHLRQMDQYKWYQIRTNADGNVIDAVEASAALSEYEKNESGASQYVISYRNINNAVEKSGVDTVLYLTDGGPIFGSNGKTVANNGFRTAMEIKGNNTLAVTDQQGSGIHFRSDVNVVLQYWNRNKQEKDVLTGEGVDDLKNMVDIVNANNATRDSAYFVSALIENGFATSIVIYDSYNNYTRPDDDKTPTSNGKVTYATGLSTAIDGAISNDTVTVQPNGRVNAKFTLTAPDWAYMDASNKAVTVYFDVFMDGETDAYGSGYKTINSADNKTIVFNSNLMAAGTDKIFDNINESKGHTLSMKITGVDWPAAKVEVYNANGTAKLALTNNASENPGFLKITSDTLKFRLNTASNGAGTYTVTGAVNADDSAIGTQNFGTDVGTAQTLATVKAVGGQVVKVFVTGTVVQNYTAGAQGAAGNMAAKTLTALKTAGVTVNGVPTGSDDWDVTLAVTAPAGALAEGVTGKTYTINLANHTDGIVTEYDVFYTLTNGNTTSTGKVNIKGLGSGTGTGTVYVPAVEGNVDLTITSVEAKVVSFVVTSVTLSADKKNVTISFSEKAIATSADIAYTNSGNCIYITSDGSSDASASGAVVNADGTVTVTVSTALENGATIKVDAPVVNASGQQVKASVITLTQIADNSTWTINNK